MAGPHPKTLFREGGEQVFWGRKQSSCIVEDEEAEQKALADGWQETAIGRPKDPDPLDHDRSGKKGGSLKGAQSTRSKGKRKKEAA